MINYWASGTLPYSWNLKNVTLTWSGLDNVSNADPMWSGGDISYEYNAQGFRTVNLDHVVDKSVDIALGCSFVEGIGLPNESTVSYIVSQRTTRTVLNLGIGGGSTDTVARILTNVAPLYNIGTVYILWPDIHRFEMYRKDRIDTILPTKSSIEHVWYMDDPNAIQRFHKNRQIVQNLKDLFGFAVKEINSEWTIVGDFARDQVHPGIKSQQNLADLFLND
jgi:hypothetical protein